MCTRKYVKCHYQPKQFDKYACWHSKFTNMITKQVLKGTVHSSNIWAKSLANGSLMIVLQSRFSPNMPVGPVIFKLVSYRSIILGSIVILLVSIIIIFGSIIIIFGSIIHIRVDRHHIQVNHHHIRVNHHPFRVIHRLLVKYVLRIF